MKWRQANDGIGRDCRALRQTANITYLPIGQRLEKVAYAEGNTEPVERYAAEQGKSDAPKNGSPSFSSGRIAIGLAMNFFCCRSGWEGWLRFFLIAILLFIFGGLILDNLFIIKEDIPVNHAALHAVHSIQQLLDNSKLSDAQQYFTIHDLVALGMQKSLVGIDRISELKWLDRIHMIRVDDENSLTIIVSFIDVGDPPTSDWAHRLVARRTFCEIKGAANLFSGDVATSQRPDWPR